MILKIITDLPNIISLFLIEFDYSNYKIKIKKNFIYKDNLYDLSI